MALNPSVFKTRSLTAAVFVIVMLTGLLWNPLAFFILFSIIHFGCWSEYQEMMALIDKEYATISPFHRYSVPIAGWFLMMYFAAGNLAIAGLSLHTIGWWGCMSFLILMVIGEILQYKSLNMANVGRSALGLLYISCSMTMLFWLRTIYYASPIPFADRILVLMIIGSIWINDTMAYIVGSLIGKTPLSAISPKKTWEGTIGGIILAIGVMGLLGYFLQETPAWALFAPGNWMAIAAIAAITGTFGDLLESKLKRMAGIKDSGHILPGHGGFLDRFDSLLVAAPFAWAYLVWIIGVGN
ncbi:MAG TPA: phosphatidate cytidylyltransferase [Puia sp.]|jgi:phosphatidate cytidylyltransferase|nr:phosphatidate cytidylyltransferase [Puia sp.]